MIKAKLLILFLGLLMVGCGEQVIDKSELEGRNGLAYLTNEKTPFTGRAESLFSKGQKREEINLKDGLADGRYTLWYRNGQKREEGNYKHGKKEGTWTAWHENGQKWWEETYKGDKKDGLATGWYENGQTRQERSFKEDKLMVAEVWKLNGEKCAVTNVEDGNGIWVLYNDDGTERFRYTYKDGERVRN